MKREKSRNRKTFPLLRDVTPETNPDTLLLYAVARLSLGSCLTLSLLPRMYCRCRKDAYLISTAVIITTVLCSSQDSAHIHLPVNKLSTYSLTWQYIIVGDKALLLLCPV